MLDTSRIEAGTFSYQFGDVDVASLIDDVVTTASVRQAEIPVRAVRVEPLPPVAGDRERLRQVLTNLIENAVKYSAEGDAVEVSAQRDDRYVRIAVSDRGPGIPDDQQQLIFQKFGRAEVEGGSKPGTGLGLFIARSIAEAHGGTLTVQSRRDGGATFTLSLPL